MWCGAFTALCVAVGLSEFFYKYSFGYIGENLTYYVRNKLFSGIIYKQVSWFDSKDRAPGILSNVLSEDVTALNGLTTKTLGLLIEGLLTLVVGALLGLFYSWKMALITIGVSPFIILGGIMVTRFQWKKNKAGIDDPVLGVVNPYE